MKTLFDTDEEEEVKASEITLSTASLLGIFFGLVLICEMCIRDSLHSDRRQRTAVSPSSNNIHHGGTEKHQNLKNH